ncbi:hydrophobic surface binding protein A-domain-containing protein [Aspergillus cavernicola]|uniref:Hydrophobic surface binding protein A-domain-containing protein n=1 Tax=Aspergillus cavernicola TaxID=176166 RepID=A0ABR4IDT9_9EURO
MKFATSILTLTLAYSAFAEPIPNQKRSLADYQNVFNGISAQVGVVSGNVASYVAGTIAGTVVQDSSNDLVDIINTGATNVAGFAALGTLDALSLVGPIQTLTADVSDLIDAVIGAEPNFDADGLSADVLASLQGQRAGAEALRDAITPKVPAAVQEIAADLAEGIVTEIDRGIVAYSD